MRYLFLSHRFFRRGHHVECCLGTIIAVDGDVIDPGQPCQNLKYLSNMHRHKIGVSRLTVVVRRVQEFGQQISMSFLRLEERSQVA